jgi:YegS/Rv2252/BmrU family lipid kinase
MKTVAVVNPNSSGGKTTAAWRKLEAGLRDAVSTLEVRWTTGMGDATRLTREALEQGAEQIVAVGGDGTINEVVNGFMGESGPINPEAVLGLLSSGTGSDFRRTFDLPSELDGQLARLHHGTIRLIDIGKLTYTTDSGDTAVRYFDNIASFGLSGHIVRTVNRQTIAKQFGGKFAFQWALTKSAVFYQNQTVRLQVDDHFDEEITFKTIGVCNGCYFGGSMYFAPHAKPDDGQFEVVILGDVGLTYLMAHSNDVYDGRHIDDPNVRCTAGQRIVATPVNDKSEILLDVDGEAPGRLPATFEILPNAIRIRC